MAREFCFFKNKLVSQSSFTGRAAPRGLWCPRPRLGFRVERIDPLRFLFGCRKRRLNQALSVLDLIPGFF